MNSTNKILNSFNELEEHLNTKNISLICMNIRSIRKNFTEFLTRTNNIINKITAIILTETNICDDENKFYAINGYNSIFLNRINRGGGIAVYIKDTVSFKTFITNTQFMESLQVDLSISIDKIITILACYRPPNLNVKNFIKELDNCINNINKRQDIILTGDMNLDIISNNMSSKNYLDMCACNGLECAVSGITRECERNGSRTCIDHLFIRHNSRNNIKSAIIATTISDHYSISKL